MHRQTFVQDGIRKDTSGNVALLSAAAVIPLLALIGGGIDISRGYMAETQLQSACDAGVLAGRRAMSKTGEYTTTEQAKATRMFNFNFNPDSVSASNFTFVTEASESGEVTGTATATIPTIVMSIFNFEKIDLSVDCMAELQIANADVMFVLDTTGSMAGSRIAALREAVKDFHRTMNGSVKDQNTRIRYGFVPYSMTVNALDLVSSGAMPTEYFVDIWDYQTRVAQFNTVTHVPDTVNDLGTTNETYKNTIESSDCSKYGNNKYPDNKGQNPETSGSAPGKVKTYTYSFYSWDGSGKGSKGTCIRAVHTTETTYTTKFAFTNWRYQQWPLDTSDFKILSTVAVGTDVSSAYADQADSHYDMVTMAKKNGSELHNVGTTNMTWNGCIEERDTVDDEEWDPIPDGAYDHDLDSAPTSDETRWRPMWTGVEYYRSHHQHEDSTAQYRENASSACPSPMKLFTEVELSEDPEDIPDWLDTYLTNLVPTGNTYHDIGMIWGGRLSSSRGIFASNVNQDNKAVSRHLIFMTDGEMKPLITGYSAYGIETLDNRVAPKNSNTATVTARHTQRLLAACKAIKAQGTTIWVIAFGTSLSTDLKTCSSDGRAYQSDDADELSQTFKFIASQVANLRLGR